MITFGVCPLFSIPNVLWCAPFSQFLRYCEMAKETSGPFFCQERGGQIRNPPMYLFPGMGGILTYDSTLWSSPCMHDPLFFRRTPYERLRRLSFCPLSSRMGQWMHIDDNYSLHQWYREVTWVFPITTTSSMMLIPISIPVVGIVDMRKAPANLGFRFTLACT